MSKAKIQDNVLNILIEGFKVYFKHFGKFTQYMLFPVLGQVLGIVLIFALAGWINFSLPVWVDKFSVLNNFMTITILLLTVTLPGFVIFLKAFWDFLVAYGALNSMTQAVITTGKLYDFKAHTEVITKRSFSFICLLSVICVLAFIAVNPLFWVLGLIFFVYFVLVFQVFTFEENISILDCFKRSFFLVKGNFARTFAIMAVLGCVCCFLLNYGLSALFDVIKLNELFKGILENWALNLPLDDINVSLATFRIPAITPLDVAKQILSSGILFVAAGLTLPLRSICWTLWYKNLNEVKSEKISKKGK